MLTAEGCHTRRRRLWDQLPDKPDWLLIFDPQHLVYLANYFQTPFVFRSTNAAAVLILGADGSSILVADNQLQAFADHAHVDEVVAPLWYRGRESAEHRKALLVATALDRLQSCPGRHFGYEAAAVPEGIVAGLRDARGGLRLTNLDPIIHRLKRSKDADEMALMRRAIAAADAAEDAALRNLRPGMTEFETFLLVQEAAQRAAGAQVQIYGDFVSGQRCQQGGGPPTDRVIQKGDLVLVDFSVVLWGYRGDLCNTFACGAEPTDEQRRLHAACLRALGAAEQRIRAGTPGREIDRAVRESFATENLAENFRSHSGHGLGLGHPDPPYLVPESSDTLVAGDVIAVEPGQYIAGVAGMRYERNYHVTADGYELLSHLRLEIDQQA